MCSGQRVRTCGGFGRARRTRGVLCGHAAAVTALAFAGGTRLLVSASLDSTARLWACKTLTCLRVLHAHSRYLTCIAVPPDFRYLITGSNDRTVRTWSLGTLDLDDEVAPPCALLSHFGLGDLKGIEPMLDEELAEDCSAEECARSGVEGAPPKRLWVSEKTHVGAINSIVTYKDLLVTACSDGGVRVFRWSARRGELACERTLLAHRFPAAAADLTVMGDADILLLSAGLDGRALLWDLQSGCELWSVSTGSAGGVTGVTGAGGGVRGARLSPHRPPLLLLAMDDGALAVWTTQQSHTEPIQ
ncbi:PREDICTED: platelet-activating factor acetylhydrolase IB subunit alpha-like [Papilio xuthus]|uniref:Platelet-activating factor acetylhydrolase IB subunit alpha-like n=1 Tax=Papilio xuthus TaxID=66420 RepID=A0AAJ6ZV73_PAPXU|nr:PREDICTED: platelet-activating factor acetylhydrolase IB subunit alpha-like [Papilio xuthus]